MGSSGQYKKGIILAGGRGSRLYPATRGVNKQLLPVYDKPMIYYPLSTLMLAGIQNILIISTPEHLERLQHLLGDGGQLGITLHYAVQTHPDGLPQAYIIGREFIGKDPVAMILGDNIFYSQQLKQTLCKVAQRNSGGTIFTRAVNNPQHYGILEIDSDRVPVSLEEKPAIPKSDLAVTGLYFFDNRVIDIATELKPSARGETEILDVIRHYMEKGELHVEPLDSESVWFDVGTPESLLRAASFIAATQEEHRTRIGCLEETAHTMGFISLEQFEKLAATLHNSYGDYLRSRIGLYS